MFCLHRPSGGSNSALTPLNSLPTPTTTSNDGPNDNGPSDLLEKQLEQDPGPEKQEEQEGTRRIQTTEPESKEQNADPRTIQTHHAGPTNQKFKPLAPTLQFEEF